MDRGYPVIRPARAAWLSAATLAGVLVIGATLVQSLSESAAAMRRGGQAATAAHNYTAGLEAWGDPATPEPLRDSVRATLTVRFRELRAELAAPGDAALIDSVIAGVRSSEREISAPTRQAMVAFLASQDEALFAAADEAERAKRYAMVLMALAAITAGVLLVPMAWLWVHHKAGPTTP